MRKGTSMINYKKKIIQEQKRISDLSDENLKEEFLRMISDPKVFGTVASVLYSQARTLLNENLVAQHAEYLLRGGEGDEKDKFDEIRNNALVDVINIGYVMKNITSSFDAKKFMETYKK